MPGIQVVGGIVLNRAVGGINPYAVQAALQLGAKHVWMPTVDAANHARTFGSTGAYDKQASSVADTSDTGIEVIDDAGTPIDGLIDVLDLIAEHSAILSTCHLSVPEIKQLVPLARERGVEKIMITHPFFKVPNLDLDTLKELVALGAYAEFGYCTVSPMWNHAPLTRVVEAIKEVGPEHSILMSDAGQRHNPMPAECLRVFAQSVYESGISEDGVERMIKHNPLELLELGPRREPVAPPVPVAPSAASNGAGATEPDGHVALERESGGVGDEHAHRLDRPVLQHRRRARLLHAPARGLLGAHRAHVPRGDHPRGRVGDARRARSQGDRRPGDGAARRRRVRVHQRRRVAGQPVRGRADRGGSRSRRARRRSAWRRRCGARSTPRSPIGSA